MFSGKIEKERGAMLKSQFLSQFAHIAALLLKACHGSKLCHMLKMAWETVQPKFEAARSMGPC